MYKQPSRDLRVGLGGKSITVRKGKALLQITGVCCVEPLFLSYVIPY